MKTHYVYQSTYPIKVHFQGTFQNVVNEEERQFNKAMSHVRTNVEWLFGDVENFLNFIEFRKGIEFFSAAGKILLSLWNTP